MSSLMQILSLSAQDYLACYHNFEQHFSMMGYPSDLDGSRLPILYSSYAQALLCFKFSNIVFQDFWNSALHEPPARNKAQISQTLKDISKSFEFKCMIHAPNYILYLFCLDNENGHTSIAIFTPGSNSLYFYSVSNKLNNEIRNLRHLFSYTLHKLNKSFSFHHIRHRYLPAIPNYEKNSLYRAKILSLLLQDFVYTEDQGFVISSANFLLKNFSYSLKDFDIFEFEAEIKEFFKMFAENYSFLNLVPLSECTSGEHLRTSQVFSDKFDPSPDYFAHKPLISFNFSSEISEFQEGTMRQTGNNSGHSEKGDKEEGLSCKNDTLPIEENTNDVSPTEVSQPPNQLDPTQAISPNLKWKTMGELILLLKQANTLAKALHSCHPLQSVSWVFLENAVKKDRSILRHWVMNTVLAGKPFNRNPRIQKLFVIFFERLGMSCPRLLRPGTYYLLQNVQRLMRHDHLMAPSERRELVLSLEPLSLNELKEGSPAVPEQVPEQVPETPEQVPGTSEQRPEDNEPVDEQLPELQSDPEDQVDQPSSDTQRQVYSEQNKNNSMVAAVATSPKPGSREPKDAKTKAKNAKRPKPAVQETASYNMTANQLKAGSPAVSPVPTGMRDVQMSNAQEALVSGEQNVQASTAEEIQHSTPMEVEEEKSSSAVLEKQAVTPKPAVEKNSVGAMSPADIETLAVKGEPAVVTNLAAVKKPAVRTKPAVMENSAVTTKPMNVETPAVTTKPAVVEKIAVAAKPAVVEKQISVSNTPVVKKVNPATSATTTSKPVKSVPVSKQTTSAPPAAIKVKSETQLMVPKKTSSPSSTTNEKNTEIDSLRRKIAAATNEMTPEEAVIRFREGNTTKKMTPHELMEKMKEDIARRESSKKESKPTKDSSQLAELAKPEKISAKAGNQREDLPKKQREHTRGSRREDHKKVGSRQPSVEVTPRQHSIEDDRRRQRSVDDKQQQRSVDRSQRRQHSTDSLRVAATAQKVKDTAKQKVEATAQQQKTTTRPLSPRPVKRADKTVQKSAKVVASGRSTETGGSSSHLPSSSRPTSKERKSAASVEGRRIVSTVKAGSSSDTTKPNKPAKRLHLEKSAPEEDEKACLGRPPLFTVQVNKDTTVKSASKSSATKKKGKRAINKVNNDQALADHYAEILQMEGMEGIMEDQTYSNCPIDEPSRPSPRPTSPYPPSTRPPPPSTSSAQATPMETDSGWIQLDAHTSIRRNPPSRQIIHLSASVPTPSRSLTSPSAPPLTRTAPPRDRRPPPPPPTHTETRYSTGGTLTRFTSVPPPPERPRGNLAPEVITLDDEEPEPMDTS